MSAESAYVDRTQKNETLSMACAVGARRIQEVANLDASQQRQSVQDALSISGDHRSISSRYEESEYLQ